MHEKKGFVDLVMTFAEIKSSYFLKSCQSLAGTKVRRGSDVKYSVFGPECEMKNLYNF